MDRLWRSNSSISSRTGCPPDIVNEEDHNVDDSEISDFSKWTIPKVDTKNVYKISWAENTFHSAYKVRTVEQIFSISRTHEKCCLFSKKNIGEYLASKKFSYLHNGMVQVAIKPLTRKGINASVLMCLRDTRFKHFKDSILGMITASLYDGPVYIFLQSFYLHYLPNILLSLYNCALASIAVSPSPFMVSEPTCSGRW